MENIKPHVPYMHWTEAERRGLPIFNSGVIYTYVAYDGKLMKIGKSNDPFARIKGMATGNAGINLLMYGCGASEKDMHEKFQKKRKSGEWFDLDINDLLQIEKDLSFLFEDYFYTPNNYDRLMNKIADKGLTEPSFGVIVTGSKDFEDRDFIESVLDKALKNKKSVQIISGRASTVDYIAEDYAAENNHRVIKFMADFDNKGNNAGYLRNEDMAKYADGCICFWDGKSKCTRHMIDVAKMYNIPTRVIDISKRVYLAKTLT